MTTAEWIWLGVGTGGQACFGGRMVVQWWVSERQQKSVIPLAFWHMSLLGGALTLAYAIYRRDPVFVAAQVLGMAVYLRNLRLLARSGPLPDTPSRSGDSAGAASGSPAADTLAAPRGGQAGEPLAHPATTCRCTCTCGADPLRRAS